MSRLASSPVVRCSPSSAGGPSYRKTALPVPSAGPVSAGACSIGSTCRFHSPTFSSRSLASLSPRRKIRQRPGGELPGALGLQHEQQGPVGQRGGPAEPSGGVDQKVVRVRFAERRRFVGGQPEVAVAVLLAGVFHVEVGRGALVRDDLGAVPVERAGAEPAGRRQRPRSRRCTHPPPGPGAGVGAGVGQSAAGPRAGHSNPRPHPEAILAAARRDQAADAMAFRSSSVPTSVRLPRTNRGLSRGVVFQVRDRSPRLCS